MRNDVNVVDKCLRCVKDIIAANKSMKFCNEDIGFFVSGFQKMNANKTTLSLLDVLCESIENSIESTPVDNKHVESKGGDMRSLSSALGGLSRMSDENDTIKRLLSILYIKLCKDVSTRDTTDALVQYSFFGFDSKF